MLKKFIYAFLFLLIPSCVLSTESIAQSPSDPHAMCVFQAINIFNHTCLKKCTTPPIMGLGMTPDLPTWHALQVGLSTCPEQCVSDLKQGLEHCQRVKLR